MTVIGMGFKALILIVLVLAGNSAIENLCIIIIIIIIIIITAAPSKKKKEEEEEQEEQQERRRRRRRSPEKKKDYSDNRNKSPGHTVVSVGIREATECYKRIVGTCLFPFKTDFPYYCPVLLLLFLFCCRRFSHSLDSFRLRSWQSVGRKIFGLNW